MRLLLEQKQGLVLYKIMYIKNNKYSSQMGCAFFVG